MNDLLNPLSPRNPNNLSHNGDGDEGFENNKKEDTYVEGAEFIPLPSKGLFYNFSPNYIGLESLKVRQLNFEDEDILTTRSFFENGTLFIELLKQTIVDQNGFPATQLVPIDRDTILLWLRSTSFGNIYEVDFECPNCKHKNQLSWDLSKLEIPQYEQEVEEELRQNAGELELFTPQRRIRVKISVPTLTAAKNFERLVSAKKNNTGKETLGTSSLYLIVTAVYDEENNTWIRRRPEIEQYFKKKNLTLFDMRFIKKQFEKISLKYDTTKTMTCSSCGHVEEGVEMPILHPNFFWIDK